MVLISSNVEFTSRYLLGLMKKSIFIRVPINKAVKSGVLYYWQMKYLAVRLTDDAFFGINADRIIYLINLAVKVPFGYATGSQ
jgi:hypothetical protein